MELLEPSLQNMVHLTRVALLVASRCCLGEIAILFDLEGILSLVAIVVLPHYSQDTALYNGQSLHSGSNHHSRRLTIHSRRQKNALLHIRVGWSWKMGCLITLMLPLALLLGVPSSKVMTLVTKALQAMTRMRLIVLLLLSSGGGCCCHTNQHYSSMLLFIHLMTHVFSHDNTINQNLEAGKCVVHQLVPHGIDESTQKMVPYLSIWTPLQKHNVTRNEFVIVLSY